MCSQVSSSSSVLETRPSRKACTTVSSASASIAAQQSRSRSRVDVAPSALAAAARLGAEHTIEATDPASTAAHVRELTGGGVQHSFEVVGLEATTLQAVRMTAVGGTAYLVGLHKPGAVLGLDVMADLMVPQRSIVAVYMGSTDIHRDIPRYARLALDGELDLAALVAEEIALDDLDAGFDRMRTGRAARSVVTAF